MFQNKVKEIQDKLRQLDVVFVVDTTSSMESSISEVRKRLRQFAQELASSEVRPQIAFGIVAYRDHPPEDTTYVVQPYPLVSDLNKAQANIDSLKAHGGGDGPEAVLDGLHAGLKAKWHDYSHKVLLLVGDAPPHGAGASGDHWPKGCPCGLSIEKVLAQAKSAGAVIHSVGVRSDTIMAQSFTQIAKGTGGEYIPLSRITELIPRILSLLRTELGKVASDIDVFGAWAVSSDKSAPSLANALGKSTGEVDESLARLRAKGVLAESLTADTFRGMLGGRPAPVEGGATTSAPSPMSSSSPVIEPELLNMISIGDPMGPINMAGGDTSDHVEIRILNE